MTSRQLTVRFAAVDRRPAPANCLRQANVPVLGAILNNLDLHQYGYTYRKNYYDYYESADEDSEKSRKTS